MSLTHPNAFFSLEDFEHENLFRDCEHVWDAIKNISSYLNSQPLGKIEVQIPAGVHLQDAHLISIAKGCVIEPGAFIQGPCLIGEGSTVRHGAYIRGHVIVGKNCVIGHGTEIKHSILLNDAAAPHFNYVGNSILGNHTNLGAGVICANLRLDKKPITVKMGKEFFLTGMQKLGLILGDHGQMGCNSVANPGTVMGKEATCAPCVNVGGWVPEGSMVKGQKIIVEAR